MTDAEFEKRKHMAYVMGVVSFGCLIGSLIAMAAIVWHVFG